VPRKSGPCLQGRAGNRGPHRRTTSCSRRKRKAETERFYIREK
jgi:hypothetical protein